MPIYSLSSLLSLDSWARTDQTRRAFRSSRKLIVSDSTVERVLRWLKTEQLHSLLLSPAAAFDRHHLLERSLVAGGRARRIGILDGTFQSGQWLLYLTLFGAIRYTVEIRPLKNNGQELSTAKHLIPEARATLGALWPQLLLVDALYFAQTVFRLVRSSGAHLLVKFDEADLREVSADAENLFRFWGADREVSGFDGERLCSYTVRVTEDEYYGIPVQVAEVTEYYCKRQGENQNVHFWVVTTDLSLSPEEIREAAHARWQVENNQFKRQNFLCGTKHGYSRHPRVFLNLLLLLCLSLAVIDALRVLLAAHAKLAKRLLEGRKPTWRGWCQALSENVPSGLFALPP